MDSDGFTTKGGSKGGKNGEPVRNRDQASFLREVPGYSGTSEEFKKAHAQRYRNEEKFEADGSHQSGPQFFPPGSDRSIKHAQYNSSTNARDTTRREYDNGLLAAEREYGKLRPDEQSYYNANRGSLLPEQHEVLYPKAMKYADKSYSNGKHRENFLLAHPVGYHNMEEQQRHHDYASQAYGECDYASKQEKLHKDNRSSQKLDSREDRYGRPVPRRQ